jgi:hypothetical protein
MRNRTLEFRLISLLRHAINLLESELVGNIKNRCIVSLVTTFIGILAFGRWVRPGKN